MDKKIDSLAHAFIQKSKTVGLCIGIIQNGNIATHGYGETEKGSGKTPDADNIFEIGSITKTFTAAILAWHVMEGEISLDDPITKYLPEGLACNSTLQKIKVLHLSNHTSGLPRLPLSFFLRFTKINNPYKGYNTRMLFPAKYMLIQIWQRVCSALSLKASAGNHLSNWWKKLLPAR
jgi:CubicO group peptidase (beta-lactamase class C family)